MPSTSGLFHALHRLSAARHTSKSLRFQRDTHRARLLGWGLFFPFFAYLFTLAKAPVAAFVALAAMSLMYPMVMTLVTLRAKDPIRALGISLIFEGAALGVLDEFACLHPLLVTVTFTVAVINAGSVRGIKVSGAALAAACGAAWLVHGRLRVVDSLELSVSSSFLLTAYLLGYTLYVTQISHASVRAFVRARDELAEKKRRIEGLHSHLLESIATPYVSETEILELLSGEIDENLAKEYVERLRSRQRLENLGRRAAIVSHDLRNLLQPIIVSGELLREELQHRNDDLELVDDIVMASRRASGIVQHLVRSSTASSPSVKQCVPSGVIREVASLLTARAHGTAVEVIARVDPLLDSLSAEQNATTVPIDSDALHRVLMNLGVNALQALDGAGTLTFDVHPISSAELELVGPLPPNVDVASAVVVAVADDGPGMPPEVMERIFEPYFTTRPDSGGTGLGLSTTFALVTDAGGVLRVESDEGHGTTFRIVLPAVNPLPATPPSLALPPSP